MKKTIYLLVAVSFVFGLVLMTATNAQEQEREREHNSAAVGAPEGLEKIHSPEEIKDFRGIKNVGGALFGVRVSTTTDGSIMITPVGTSTLEKISHPSLLNLYEKIRKIGTALWGYKKPEANGGLVISSEIATCVNAAIDVKDKALMARVTVAAIELNAAITARSTCQQTAIIASSTPRSALNACVKTFQDARKTIKEASKKVQETSWNTYKESLKACRASSTQAVPMIEDGGNIFE